MPDWPGTFQEFVEGMVGNFGADTALEYVMQGSFVKGMERKCQEAAQKLHCLIHGSVCRLISSGDFRG